MRVAKIAIDRLVAQAALAAAVARWREGAGAAFTVLKHRERGVHARKCNGRWFSSLVPVSSFALLALTATLALGAACGGGETSTGTGVAQPEHPGQQNYLTHCASCHGMRGEGQPNWLIPGPDGLLLAPPHDNNGHTWHHGDGYLFQVTKRGGAAFVMPGQPSGMPGFDVQLTDREIVEVLEYIKGFWGSDERAFQASASRGDPYP